MIKDIKGHQVNIDKITAYAYNKDQSTLTLEFGDDSLKVQAYYTEIDALKSAISAEKFVPFTKVSSGVEIGVKPEAIVRYHHDGKQTLNLRLGGRSQSLTNNYCYAADFKEFDEAVQKTLRLQSLAR